MPASLPDFYTRLEPFREVFARGRPILTYHKLGPRPGGVKMKGLYVSQRLFAQQLAELRRAGFQSGRLDDFPAAAAGARRVVVTFDDGCVNVLRHGLDPLAANGFQAIQFLVAGLLGRRSEWQAPFGEVLEPLMDAAQVRDWLAAGHDLGAHSLSHPWLTRLPTAAAREEITASRKLLEDTFGRPVRHFCYPYGDWNPAVRDLVAEAGFLTACTTEPGANVPGTPPLELRRFTARYRSRNWKNLFAWLRGR